MSEEDIKQEDQNTEEVVEDVEESGEPSPADEALSKGWLPKEEYKGDLSEWVSAEEFLARAPLYKAIHVSKRKVKQLEAALGDIRQMFDKVQTRATADAMETLKKEFNEKAEAGDVAGAIEVRDKMQTVTQAATPQPVNAQPIYDAWVVKNDWFVNDPKLKRYANGVASELLTELVGIKGDLRNFTKEDYESIYEDVSTNVREAFPDQFMTDVKGKSKVSTSTRRTTVLQKKADKKSSELAFNDLPDEARTIGRRLVRLGQFTEEKYIENYRKGGGKLRNEDE